MKEISAIVSAYEKIDFSHTQAALATVVRVEGSSYRRTGARMLVISTGEWIGGISGGCLEGDALKRARLAMSTNKATLITYDTTDDDPYQIGVGLGCNGIIDVLLTPLDPQNKENAVQILKESVVARMPTLVLTCTHTDGQTSVNLGDTFRFDTNFDEKFPDKKLVEQLRNDCTEALANQKSISKIYTTATGSITILLEVILPAVQLIVQGGNYDIYAMVRIAKEVGWMVTVICNPQKAHKSLFALADAVVDKHTDIETDSFTVTILMNHDYENDYNALQKALNKNLGYIGMLGPRKRTDKMFVRMKDESLHFSEQQLNTIYSPVGLDIGAATPEEIAVSVIAEIRAYFSNRTGGNLRLRNKPIYED
jgi:xanthine dehydrogenase accessory factor